jgi:hypothetical protein
MAHYKIDRKLLESLPTEEIIRILKEEADDYTPEAIQVFREILQARGVGLEKGRTPTTDRGVLASGQPHSLQGVLIQKPSDAVSMLNTLLNRVLDGGMEPQVAQVAANIIMGILKAMEQEFMQGSGEEE